MRTVSEKRRAIGEQGQGTEGDRHPDRPKAGHGRGEKQPDAHPTHTHKCQRIVVSHRFPFEEISIALLDVYNVKNFNRKFELYTK